MELLLNLIWLVIAIAAVLAWVVLGRKSSYPDTPGMLRGLMVVVCILALLFPVISITDDLSQTISLAEGARFQDMLKAPELRGIYHLAAALPAILVSFRAEAQAQIVSRSLNPEIRVCLRQVLLVPTIEKRPPPALA